MSTNPHGQSEVEYRHVWSNGAARAGLTKESAENLARLYGGAVQERDVTPWRESETRA